MVNFVGGESKCSILNITERGNGRVFVLDIAGKRRDGPQVCCGEAGSDVVGFKNCWVNRYGPRLKVEATTITLTLLYTERVSV